MSDPSGMAARTVTQTRESAVRFPMKERLLRTGLVCESYAVQHRRKRLLVLPEIALRRHGQE
jgi:hypothetical protein